MFQYYVTFLRKPREAKVYVGAVVRRRRREAGSVVDVDLTGERTQNATNTSIVGALVT